MTNSIEQLSAKLEELDKRLKALSTTQNISIAVMNMRDYIHETKTFLSDLLSAYQNHISTSNNYSQQIENLQTQLNQISQKIDSILSAENFDPNQITADIEALQNSLSTLSAESADAIQNLQNQISENSQNISNVSTTLNQTTATANQNQADIQSLTIQTTNLQTAQTNLSTTQTNLTSTVSNLNSRLTSAEQEITALNGGVDLTELDETVNSLEKSDCFSNCFAYKKVDLNITPSDLMLYTREYYYCCKASSHIVLKIRLNYIATNGGTANIVLLINGNSAKEYSINLEQNPNTYELTYIYLPSYMAQTLKLNCNFTQLIKIENIEFEIYGQGVNFFNYNKNVRIHCFDGYKYVSKIENGVLYYDKISQSQNIDLNNLSNSISLSSDINSCSDIEYFIYTENDSSIKYFTIISDALLYTYTNGKRKLIGIDNTNYSKNFQTYGFGDCCVGLYSLPHCGYIDKNTHTPYVGGLTAQGGNRSYNNITSVATGEWVYCTVVKNNNRNSSDQIINVWNIDCIAQNQDGYMYYLPKLSLTYGVKIGKGISATAYKQIDGSINVYINSLNSTDKYTLILNTTSNKYESSFVEHIPNCDCVYETYNEIIKHNISDNEWLIDLI